ncbi:hypothetical protein OIE66_28385 [Nonomuraea sp. NBC_01738]|uniref:hypothetical protein n=1 Tax=Nonomuraea sp. NBC_01738 TaxID=2976003 RepID=UPI002E113F87|nr:hypothetical protein OIE66_28385 [Nonomuraea sp. NBC_01738]
MIVIALLALSAGLLAPVPLPGTGVTLQERADDPVRLAAYGFGTGRTYLRAVSGDTFARQHGFSEVAVAPDGRRAAGVPGSYRSGWDSVVVTDRVTGKSSRIRTVKKPQTASYASWSRDGTKIALTVERKSAGKWRATGFTVVDVTTGLARTVSVPKVAAGAGFWWSPDGNLVAEYRDGLRYYRPADGKVVRTHPGAGLPTGPEDSFSPSGRRLATWCPAKYTEQLCVADPATGAITRRVKVKPEALFGWWDEDHVIAVLAYRKAYRLAVVDLSGATTRVLGGIPAKTWGARYWMGFTRKR